MYDFRVELAVANTQTDDDRRMQIKVIADGRFQAALAAERLGDAMLEQPDLEFTHTVGVTGLGRPVAAVAA